MKRGLVVVTGAAKPVGAQAVALLLEAGYQVRALREPGQDASAAQEAGAEVIELELLDGPAVASALRKARGVIHAAYAEDTSLPWNDLYDANARSTEVLCEKALLAGVDRFVHVSSTSVYARSEKTPIGESAPTEPWTEEGRSRLQAEEYVWQAQRFEGLPAAVLRAAPTYGVGSRGLMGNLMALYAVAREGDLPWIRRLEGGPLTHHVHARDVAAAALLLLRRVESIGQVYNVADTTPLTWGELTQFLCNLCNARCPVLYAPGPVARAMAVAGRWLPSERLLEMNRELARSWESLCQRDQVVEALHPRLGRELLGLLAADELYDVSAISALGFQWSYPRTLAGLREVYDGYMAARWLPGSPDLEAQGTHAAG